MTKFISGLDSLAGARLTLLRRGPVELYRAQLSRATVLAAIPLAPASDASREQLRYEFSIRAKCDEGFSLRPLRFAVHNQNPALLLEDPGGDMLASQLAASTTAEEFLGDALRLAQSLQAAHESGLIHGGLAPSNIMIPPGGLPPRLTGFRKRGSVAVLPALDGAEQEIELGILDYMAPEATGRVNRILDNRSDLYSLGCIFYRLLTGTVLFPGLSPWELGHAHIARRPEARELIKLRRVFGEPIVELVCRLLAKEPDERYQNARDVVDDLIALSISPSATGSTNILRRAESPFGRTLNLIGRRRELERLHAAIRDRTGETRRLLLVEGPAGIGKTALINQFRAEEGVDACEFAHGKCEVGDGVTPYASLARALQTLLKAALAYHPKQFDELRRQLAEALSDDSSFITANFPDFTHLLGEHTHHAAVSPHVERMRFLAAVAKLLSAFGSPTRPLLLFLDDLQWVDEATLEVVCYLMNDPYCHHVMLMAAMRDRETERQGAHVRPFLSENLIERIQLGPLSGSEVSALVQAILDDEVGDLKVLESAIFRSAGGNPLHTIQFTRSLVDDDVLVYDKVHGEWTASSAEVEARSDASNVVALLSTRVATLAGRALEAVQYLAILAEPASIEILCAAMGGLQAAALKHSLAEAIEQQLIEERMGEYAFMHDRVRESVYLTFSESGRQTKHLEVATNLVEHATNRGLKLGAFVVANHLTRAAMPNSPDRRRFFASSILNAAVKAKEATAYESAISYLLTARSFLGDEDEVDGGLIALIELRLGECEFICMRVATASDRLAAIRQRFLNATHRAELVRLRLAMYVALDQSDRALEVGYRYLSEEAEINLPKGPHPESVDREYQRLLRMYGNRSVDELIQLPLMVDDRIRNAVDVMTDLIPAVQFTSQEMVELLILRMINLSLEYGHSDASCYAYVCLSFVAGAKYGDYAITAAFGELAMRLPGERGLKLYAGRVQMCFGSLSLPWTGSSAEAKRHLEEATELTGRQGDLTFAVYSRRHIVTNLLFSGGSLSEAQQVAEEGLKLARDANFALVIDAFMAQAWLIRELRGVPVDIGLPDSSVDYAELMADCVSGEFQRDIAAFAFWTYRLQSAFLWDRLEDALNAEERAAAAAWASPAFLENADFVFYSGLLRMALANRSGEGIQSEHARRALAHKRTMEVWAEASPTNFRSRERLLAAEWGAFACEQSQVLSLYEEAIALADQAHDMHIQSVARELAAHYAGRCGLRSAQQGYLVQARSAFATWGADAKVRQLHTAFPHLLTRRQTELHPLEVALTWSEDRFEAEVVLRAVRALSGEISLSKVIEVILNNALQYAGAERAVLCLIENGRLDVAAHARLVNCQIEVDLLRQPLSEDLLATPIAYSTLRSKGSVVLRDAREDEQYRLHSYVKVHRPRSIMCVPLVKQGVLTGLLYLENALAADVFNAARVRTLEVLASQAAVSLDNAQLYESVDAEHRRRAEAERHVREAQAKLAEVTRLSELGELAAFIVHEISQPITALGLYARSAIRWLNREIPKLDQAVAALEMISASSDRARSIIESIRSMVRESRPNISRMDFDEAILEVLRVLKERIDVERVTIATDFEEGPLSILGDRILLQQVVANLLTNALDAMSGIQDRPKEITIQTRRDAEGMMWTSVRDTGSGISEAIASRIFESLATTKGYGMGMGLSICRSVVEAHGGIIEVSSSGADGTTFRFSIPTAPS
ncbi:AAA family ATPase [Cupriavidus sp. SIMBA_020]|uniref:trifunctional serine/threonine-protein kinase/ATP-binding protein/sensor histidine kinase n=2 Tax=Bacteria TaxID=2 RepID=UPI0028BE6210|nr:AAA family ATPase [Cupriavidus sp.]